MTVARSEGCTRQAELPLMLPWSHQEVPGVPIVVVFGQGVRFVGQDGDRGRDIAEAGAQVQAGD